MTTHRAYRPAMPVDAALAELRRCSGTQFDPAVVVTLVQVIDVDEAPSVRAATPAAVLETAPA